MVDETQPDFLQIDEDEDSGVSNFTAFDLLQQPSKFKEELNLFFEDVSKYTNENNPLIFDYNQVIDKKYYPICEIDIDGIPNNINPRFEKIIKNLF